MTATMRFLFALLLGFICGAGAVFYLVQSGTGDFMIARTEAVQDLQRRLRDVEEQRDQLRRQLSDVVGRAGRMETEFAAMESRFVELQRKIEAALGRAPEAPGAAAPPAAATADPPAE